MRNSSLLILLFKFNNFLFVIDIIDNIIYASETCHQNSNHWQCSVIVMCLRLYPVTRILHCHWRDFWSLNTNQYLTYIRFGIIILTQFYVNFSRYMFYMYHSTPEILMFQPIPPLLFPLQSL